MPRIKNVMSKVYKSPRRPFEKERLDQVRSHRTLNKNPKSLPGDRRVVDMLPNAEQLFQVSLPSATCHCLLTLPWLLPTSLIAEIYSSEVSFEARRSIFLPSSPLLLGGVRCIPAISTGRFLPSLSYAVSRVDLVENFFVPHGCRVLRIFKMRVPTV